MIEGYPPLSPESSEEEIALPPPATAPPSIEPPDSNNFCNLDTSSDDANNYSLDFDTADIDSWSNDLRLPRQDLPP